MRWESTGSRISWISIGTLCAASPSGPLAETERRIHKIERDLRGITEVFFLSCVRMSFLATAVGFETAQSRSGLGDALAGRHSQKNPRLVATLRYTVAMGVQVRQQ